MDGRTAGEFSYWTANICAEGTCLAPRSDHIARLSAVDSVSLCNSMKAWICCPLQNSPNDLCGKNNHKSEDHWITLTISSQRENQLYLPCVCLSFFFQNMEWNIFSIMKTPELAFVCKGKESGGTHNSIRTFNFLLFTHKCKDCPWVGVIAHCHCCTVTNLLTPCPVPVTHVAPGLKSGWGLRRGLVALGRPNPREFFDPLKGSRHSFLEPVGFWNATFSTAVSLW